MTESMTLDELVMDNRRLKINETDRFISLLTPFQKRIAVIFLIDHFMVEGKTALEIYNYLAHEDNQYKGPDSTDSADGEESERS